MPVKLYEHQKKALEEIEIGCILNGGVGSGKSITSIAYYWLQEGGGLEPFSLMTRKPPRDLYIITTARKRDDLEWHGELANFLMYPDENNKTRFGNTVIIDSWNNIRKYSEVRDAFFIFDEQRVVGSGTWVKKFLRIAQFNDWILLSATPGDTYMDYLPVFLANGFYRNKTEFLREHVVYSRYTKYPQIDKYINTQRLERLRDRVLIDMDFDRATVRHNEDVFVKYDISKYRDAMRNRWDPFEDKPIEQAAGLCYVLRRIVNSDESRQAAILELFEKHPKMIIFYSFDYERDILRNIYFGEDIPVNEWSGHAHQPVPEGPSWVYLVQYTAGCEGWNCVKTDTIVFYSQNYSYKIVEQAQGRIDRLNTPYTDLYYYHIRSRSGIDLAITRALTKKKKFNERKFAKWD